MSIAVSHAAAVHQAREPRWLVRRRAEAAAFTAKADALPVEEACRCYGVTPSQFFAWQRAGERRGRGSSIGRSFKLFRLRAR